MRMLINGGLSEDNTIHLQVKLLYNCKANTAIERCIAVEELSQLACVQQQLWWVGVFDN